MVLHGRFVGLAQLKSMARNNPTPANQVNLKHSGNKLWCPKLLGCPLLKQKERFLLP